MNKSMSQHSLFSPQALAERPHRALLLQFMLSELFQAQQIFLAGGSWEEIFSSHPRFFPYDWASPSGSLNKLREHGRLLKNSFPDRAKTVKTFETRLEKIFLKKKNPIEKSLQTLYLILEPLIEVCKNDENLTHFLLKHRQSIDCLLQKGHLHQFLIRIHPSGLETLGEKMCDQYHERGFISQIPEFKLLMTDLIHA